MQFFMDPQIHMWFAIFMTVVTFYSFANEKWPLEVTSIALLATMLLFGQVFPILDVNGKNMLGTQPLLQGFSNPSLIAVLALLVIGQAMVQTAALNPITRIFLQMKPKWAMLGLGGIFILVMLVSAVLNNTPLVILAIPILQALSAKLNIATSKVMIPLSFVAILGGMMTLVGSSTNMLVSTALEDLGYDPFGFFSFTVPGAMLAAFGAIYVFVVLPYLLPSRGTMVKDLQDEEREFIAELDIKTGDSFIGAECIDGGFSKIPDISVRMIQRSGALLLPPFDDDYRVSAGDILIVAATQQSLFDVLSSHPGFLLSEEEVKPLAEKEVDLEADNNDDENDEGKKEEEIKEIEQIATQSHILAEAMVPPTSSMIDMALTEIDFEKKYNCMVLGIQRRSHVVRRRLHQMRLQAGDVLLLTGNQKDVRKLREIKDLMILAGSSRDVPVTTRARHAGLIFLATVICAAGGILPIPVAAVVGAVFMVLFGCLTVRQVMRSFDQKIFFLVGSALALGTMLQVTNGATYIADLILELPMAQDPYYAACLLFILVAIGTNLLTNNACAILFTPIAVNLATQLNADPIVFATTVVFAANCSFASPIGYQTNLLVMGPGHYQFKDFMKAGIPLVLLMWLAYCVVAKYYFKL